MREPENMDELVYHSYRDLPNGGEARIWVFRELCEKCGKALMGKPIGEKGKVKVRAKEYVCEACGHTEQKKEFEEKLTANIQYTCGACNKAGGISIPYKKKTIKGVSTLRGYCEHCNAPVDITKKMKEPK